MAAAELDTYRRAYGLNHPPPAKHPWARRDRKERAAAPATAPIGGRAEGPRWPAERRRNHREGGRGWRDDRQPPAAARDSAHRVGPSRLLGAEPRRDHPGRRDWQIAWAALERLADHHRGDHHRPHERLGRLQARDRGRQERDGH